MRYEDFIRRATDKLTYTKYERIGQVMFTTLAELSPELTFEIMGTELDPFYDDDRIPAFLDWLYAKAEMPENFTDMVRSIWPDGEQV